MWANPSSPLWDSLFTDNIDSLGGGVKALGISNFKAESEINFHCFWASRGMMFKNNDGKHLHRPRHSSTTPLNSQILQMRLLLPAWRRVEPCVFLNQFTLLFPLPMFPSIQLFHSYPFFFSLSHSASTKQNGSHLPLRLLPWTELAFRRGTHSFQLVAQKALWKRCHSELVLVDSSRTIYRWINKPPQQKESWPKGLQERRETHTVIRRTSWKATAKTWEMWLMTGDRQRDPLASMYVSSSLSVSSFSILLPSLFPNLENLM